MLFFLKVQGLCSEAPSLDAIPECGTLHGSICASASVSVR